MPKRAATKAETTKPEQKLRRMPIKTLPPYDLGNLAEAVAETDDERAYYAGWAGWEVTYRSDMTMTIFTELGSRDNRQRVHALSLIVTGWNFVDEAGNPLPQPTRENFGQLGLSDELITLLFIGYAQALKAPKGTAKP